MFTFLWDVAFSLALKISGSRIYSVNILRGVCVYSKNIPDQNSLIRNFERRTVWYSTTFDCLPHTHGFQSSSEIQINPIQAKNGYFQINYLILRKILSKKQWSHWFTLNTLLSDCWLRYFRFDDNHLKTGTTHRIFKEPYLDKYKMGLREATFHT